MRGRGDGIVGRERELTALRGWLEAARGGAGRLVLCAGEPGIGKTRLAQELAGVALAGDTAVAWGRCAPTEGAPAYWPWRQVLRSLGVDPDAVLAGQAESPEDRFRVFDDLTQALLAVAARRGLVVVLDDIHWGDEPSLLVLRHLADQLAGTRLLVLAAFRDLEPAGVLPRVLPDLLRSPAAERIELRGFDLAEVREQLARMGADEAPADARAVLDVTGGNPLFVREVARAMADGSWRPDRPPAPCSRSSEPGSTGSPTAAADWCRRRRSSAATSLWPWSRRPSTSRSTAVSRWSTRRSPHGLLDRVGDAGDYRFVHALTRDAVEASLTGADRARLHRAAAAATEAHFAGDLGDHLGEITRHWVAVAPHGEAATARRWAIRAAQEAARRLAYEESVRLYRTALALDGTPLPQAERCQLLVALGRAAYLAGDLRGCADAAVAAADAARAAQRPALLGEAALVLEATADAGLNAVAKELCEEALAGLGDPASDALRARLLAQRSQLALYDGDQDRLPSLSAAALDLARRAGDERALVDALRAGKEARTGPDGRGRAAAAGGRDGGARPAGPQRPHHPVGDALADRGAAGGRASGGRGRGVGPAAGRRRAGGGAGQRLAPRAGHRLRRPGAGTLRRGRQRRTPRARADAPGRAGPARGSFFSLQCALAAHVGVGEDAAPFVEQPFAPLPLFRVVGRLARAFLLLQAGRPQEAAASYQQAGPLDGWSLPPFAVPLGYVYGVLVTAELGGHEELAALLQRLEPFRGGHATIQGVAYLGPVELALGRGAAALGRLDPAVDDLTVAAGQADRAGAPGFAAEARFHLAATLLARDGPGDRDRARPAARDADRLARALGMAAYRDRATALVARLGDPDAGGRAGELSPREAEVASLVAEGLTNRQIGERLVISERTAQNHVQHILTKLGFTTRSQIAAWSARTRD